MAAASAPIAIGTRGTVGSLLKKEIDYFTKFESQGRRVGRNDHSRPGFWFLITGWKKKKRRCNNNHNNNGFLPTLCSAVEVAENNQLNKIPGFSYRILENDVHNFHV